MYIILTCFTGYVSFTSVDVSNSTHNIKWFEPCVTDNDTWIPISLTMGSYSHGRTNQVLTYHAAVLGRISMGIPIVSACMQDALVWGSFSADIDFRLTLTDCIQKGLDVQDFCFAMKQRKSADLWYSSDHSQWPFRMLRMFPFERWILHRDLHPVPSTRKSSQDDNQSERHIISKITVLESRVRKCKSR